ncbi:hypothetical protein [Vibrio jasicida]|uniref:hypothetical protein n=1 Tax=Vibrio jasicida TaxID=766224 RepID=UPI0005EE9508|nr:hypothetical protein [Vibrio jasicida]
MNKISEASIEVLTRQSGATVTEAKVEYATRALEPSVTIACYYFDVPTFSVNDLFEKTGETSFNAIIEKHSQNQLANFDESEIPY